MARKIALPCRGGKVKAQTPNGTPIIARAAAPASDVVPSVVQTPDRLAYSFHWRGSLRRAGASNRSRHEMAICMYLCSAAADAWKFDGWLQTSDAASAAAERRNHCRAGTRAGAPTSYSCSSPHQQCETSCARVDAKMLPFSGGAFSGTNPGPRYAHLAALDRLRPKTNQKKMPSHHPQRA